jgi:hypothetical protein
LRVERRAMGDRSVEGERSLARGAECRGSGVLTGWSRPLGLRQRSGAIGSPVGATPQMRNAPEGMCAQEPVPSPRGLDLSRALPSTPPATPIRARTARIGDPGRAPCWAKLLRPSGLDFRAMAALANRAAPFVRYAPRGFLLHRSCLKCAFTRERREVAGYGGTTSPSLPECS